MKISTTRALGALIRELRRERGLSQEDLAATVGVSRQWIIGLEQGKARALGLVMRTLAALGLALEVVELQDRTTPPPTRVDLDRLLKSFEGIPVA